MKKTCTVLFSLLGVLMLTGCIGENYKFYPPSVSLNTSLIFEELIEVNSEWEGEGNKQLVKTTDDWFSFAKEQPTITITSGEEIGFVLEHEDYLLYDTKVTLWTMEKEKSDLYVEEDGSIDLPNVKGEYVLEFNLDTDAGEAQYVAHLLLK